MKKSDKNAAPVQRTLDDLFRDLGLVEASPGHWVRPENTQNAAPASTSQTAGISLDNQKAGVSLEAISDRFTALVETIEQERVKYLNHGFRTTLDLVDEVDAFGVDKMGELMARIKSANEAPLAKLAVLRSMTDELDRASAIRSLLLKAADVMDQELQMIEAN